MSEQQKKLREYAKDIQSLRSRRKIGKVEQEIERMCNEVFHNPYDVLLLDGSATEEDLRKQYRAFALILHPDKCKDARAKEAWTAVEQAYRTLSDPDKRKVYLRIMREAKERADFEMDRLNKKRVKEGQLPLGEAAKQEHYAQICHDIFNDLQHKKDHVVRLQQSTFARKKEELQTKKVIEQFRILTEEEWERSRDKRVNNWREFSKKKFVVGSKRSDGAVRPPPVVPQERPHYTVIEEKKKNI